MCVSKRFIFCARHNQPGQRKLIQSFDLYDPLCRLICHDVLCMDKATDVSRFNIVPAVPRIIQNIGKPVMLQLSYLACIIGLFLIDGCTFLTAYECIALINLGKPELQLKLRRNDDILMC